MSFLARGLSNLIGIVAPVIHSFKVLKKPTKPKLIQSLHFWTIYGTFLVTDWFLNTFFISCIIPFYDFFVLTFIVLLSIPHLGFASILYTKFLAPFLRKYERRIDSITGAMVEQMLQRMPAVAMAVPAVLASVVMAFNAPLMDIPQLEVEEMDDEVEVLQSIPLRRRSNSRSVSRNSGMRTPVNPVHQLLDRSFEIQEEDENDENDGGDSVFGRPHMRNVKSELLEEMEEQQDDFVVFGKQAASASRAIPPLRRSTRQLRSNSVM
ncbi:hypothetical protein CAEBREN_00940 [Caenorhabditis brenneri]|uniref:Receptor expression-enhancing protein n=1 Tax=Caenorhabditis brenneri TaxID=135651 RepID=G0NZZ0_CAEBE|nr:hypothetical protein CAEBREN_00940 [Caenorhabditis brenneri]